MTRRSLVAWSIAALAAAGSAASRLRTPSIVFESTQPTVESLVNVENVTADREFQFPKDFQLDAPFSISLSSHESVLVPLAPIRNKLFAGEEAADTIAIALELNACQGKVLTTIELDGGTSHRLSSAAYQCTTIMKQPTASPVDLCPIVHGDRDVALHMDPSKVKGFVLRAYETAEVVALFRSTKAAGAYNKAFFVDADPAIAADSRRLHVSFSAKSTTLVFNATRTWQPSDDSATANATCVGCEYTLYAEMVAPVNSSDVPPEAPPPPYCVDRKNSIASKVPTLSNATTLQRLTLPSSFGDLFNTSGDYRFVLVATIPASVNNGHPAIFTFAPVQVHVSAHIIVVLVVIAVVALLTVVAVKAELPQRLIALRSGETKPADHDDESVRLLAQVIAEQDAQDAADREHDQTPYQADDEHKSESLLDVIRKTKARDATPQPSPRHPAQAQLDGYHEIN